MRARSQITNGMGESQESNWQHVQHCVQVTRTTFWRSFSGRNLYIYIYFPNRIFFRAIV